MGFPNVDIFLVKAVLATLNELKSSAGRYKVDELFEDLDPAERQEVHQYLNAMVPTSDIRERGKRHLYVLPNFPLAEIPVPQIGISLGAEETAERWLGDDPGIDPEPVMQGDQLVAWDHYRGYWAAASWNMDLVVQTKDEAIWLSRICQLAACENFDALDAMGVKEVTVALQDVRIDPKMFPDMVFVRSVRVSAGRILNSWKKRIPVGAYTYQTGINTAL